MKTPRAQNGIATIFQPYVPNYRVPLFETVSELLAADGMILRVAHPEVFEPQAQRNDSASAEWAETIRSWSFQAGGHHFNVRRTLAAATRSEVVIAELASTNLDTYVLAAAMPSRLILWGHGRNYVTLHSRADASLERWLARRAARVLVYTDGGRTHLRAAGIRDSKISVLRNSTDTVSLRHESAAVSEQDKDAFRRSVGGLGQHVGIFVGALDPSKNLDVLLSATALIRKQIPDFRLVMAGAGPLRWHVESQLPTHPEIALLPHADQRTLALMGAVGDICLMPGRVGLIAVDAMTLGLPVVTTDWPMHAPEREYLRADFSWVTSQDPAQFAAEVVSILNDRAGLRRASEAALAASEKYSVQHMAEQMHAAIIDVRVRRAAVGRGR